MKLEEAKKSSISCIYSLVFPNGKRYIGKTKDLGDRMSIYLKFDGGSNCLRSAIDEFGWDNIDIDILSTVSCKDSIDLDICLSILEIKYIRELNSLQPNGYNSSLGGELLGIPADCITTDKDYIKSLSSNSKVVLCYDLEGNFVKEYESIARFSYENGLDSGVVRSALNRRTPIYNKWYLREKRYDYIPKQIVVSIPEKVKPRVIYQDVVKERVRYKNVVEVKYIDKVVERKVVAKRHILKYDMNGDFCGEYNNMKDACRTFLPSCTGFVCGVYRNGYILFKKESDDFPKKIEPYVVLKNKVLGDYYRPANELEDKVIKRRGITKKHTDLVEKKSDNSNKKEPLRVNGRYTNIINDFSISQYTLDGEFVASHKSIRDAADDTGLPYANIWACVMGRTKKAQGFLWKKDFDKI